MTRITAILAAALLAAPAFAAQCPADMKKIDAALATASLSEADMAKVKELRALGERQHKAGQHDQSVTTLHEAMKLLGI